MTVNRPGHAIRENPNMIKSTARLILAVVFAVALGAGAPDAGEAHLTDADNGVHDANSWNANSGLRLQPDTTDDGNIDIEISSSDAITGNGSVNGAFIMSVINADDATAAAAVRLVVSEGTTDMRFTGGATITGSGTTAATLTVTNGATLSFGGISEFRDTVRATVEAGSTLRFSNLRIDDSQLDLSVANGPSTLAVTGAGANMIVTNGLEITNGRITVSDGGSLSVGSFTMTGGDNGIEVLIKEDSDFRVTGASEAATINVGSFVIESGTNAVQFQGGLVVAAEGTMTIDRDVIFGGNGLAITSGGTVTVNSGDLSGANVNVSSGNLTLASAGEIGGGEFNITGDSVVNLGGTIASGTTMNISGGTTTFASSAIVDIKALKVSGSAAVQINTAVSTAAGVDNFVFSGGQITLGDDSYASGILNVRSTGQELTLGGKLNIVDGHASFNDDVAWTGGGVYATGTGYGGATIDMNGNRLKMDRASILDASSRSISIVNSGGLTISGTYLAGYVNNSVTRVNVTGGGELSITDRASIQMSQALQRVVNNPGTDLNSNPILASDFTGTYTGATEFTWNTGGWIYQYEVRQNSGGEWGLYVIGSSYLSEEEQYKNIISSWKRVPEVGENATKVINNDFASAIIKGNAISSGATGDYDSLSVSGKFNADVLASLSNSRNEDATYDGLMLYNGSGLGFVNQAVINSNYNILRRLRQRNDDVRNEMRVTSENLCSSLSDHSDCCLDGDKNRVWAAGFYTNENSGRDEGFAGYHYRTTGVMAGYDRLFGNLSVGGAFSYTGGDFEDSSALENNSYINTYAFNIYGSYNSPSGWFVNGAAGYAYSDDQLRDYRQLNGDTGWNTADFHTNTFMINANVGYDYVYCGNLTITGSVGLSYQRAENTGHSQFFKSDMEPLLANDVVPAANTINAGTVSNHSFQLPIEIAVKYNIYGDEDQMFTLTGSMGYAYEFNNTGADGTISYGGLGQVGSVGIVSRHPGRHVWHLGAGLKYYYKQYEFGASYEYVGRNKYNSHHFLGNFGVVF